MGMHKKTCTVIRASGEKVAKSLYKFCKYQKKAVSLQRNTKKRLHFSMLWTAGKGQSGKNNSRIALLALADCFLVQRYCFFLNWENKNRKKKPFSRKKVDFSKKMVEFCNKIQFCNKLNSFGYGK